MGLCLFLEIGFDQQVDEITGDNNVHYIPDNPPKCYGEKWLEKKSQNDEKYHPVYALILVLEICRITESGERQKTHHLVESIGHFGKA